jgi:hypothetical protein
VRSISCAAALLLALPACSREALLTVGVPGTGASAVLLLPTGAVALERDGPGLALPAIAEDVVAGQAVRALDYAARLTDLYVPSGALVDVPAGQPLPAPDRLFRLRLTEDGEGFERALAEAGARDASRRFAGVGGRTVACPQVSTRPASTGTVTLSGQPRFLVNVGPGRVWVGLEGQPARGLDTELGTYERPTDFQAGAVDLAVDLVPRFSDEPQQERLEKERVRIALDQGFSGGIELIQSEAGQRSTRGAG